MNRLNRLFGGSGRATDPGGSQPGLSGSRKDGDRGSVPDGSAVPSPSALAAGFLVHDSCPTRIIRKKQTQDKLDRITFHPVHPLIALSDRSGTVQVYDYGSDTIVYSNQFGGVDEGGMQEIVLRRRAERYSALINSAGMVDREDDDKDAVVDVRKGEKRLNQSDVRYQGMSVASGKVVDVGFVDKHFCLWQLHRQESLAVGGGDGRGEGQGIPLSWEESGEAGHNHSWVVVASENKVTMHDLASSKGVDFVRGACFEGAKPTKVVCLVRVSAGLCGEIRFSPDGSSTSPINPSTRIYKISPVLAIGTSTGSIYLIHLSSGQVVGKCAGAHSKAVTCLQVIGPAQYGGPDRLVSGSVDGTIAVWDPSRSAKGLDAKGGVCIQPITCFKAHEGGLHDLQLFGMQVGANFGAADGTKNSYSTSATSLRLQPYLASVGADRQLHTWSLTTWNKVYMPVQALPESCLVSIGATERAGVGLGSSAPLVGVSDKSCAVFALDPSASQTCHGGARVLVDLEGMLDKGDKKRPKIYSMAVSPSMPHVYGLATNTGLVIIEDVGGASVPSSTSLLSQQIFSNCFVEMELNKKDLEEGAKDPGDKEEPEPIKIPQGITSINLVDKNLVATLYEMKISKSDDSGRRERTMHLENVGSLVIAGGTGAHSDILADAGGDAIIDSSPSGRYISIVWPRYNRYLVFAHGEPDDYGRRWHFIDGGEGKQVVWSSTAPIYAVLSGSRKLDEALGSMTASTAAMAASPAAPQNVPTDKTSMSMMPGFSMTYEVIGDIDENRGNAGISTEEPETKVDGTQSEGISAEDDPLPPSYDDVMSSGPSKPAFNQSIVRVHAIQETEDGRSATYMGYSDISLDGDAVKIYGGSLLGVSSSLPSASNTYLRFFSWVDVSPIGKDLPAPNWISWDPESTMCALGYDSAVQLCAVYPHFHCFSTLGIHGSESAFWQVRQLYVSTPASINVVYVDSRQSFVEEICLADFTGQSSSIRSKESFSAVKKQSDEQSFVFGQRRLRPSGPVRLVGVKHSYLIVHDSLERPFLISLRNHGLRARSLAAKGDIDTAVALTSKYVRPVLHDGTAQCLLAMGSESDYEKVLTLPGLSPEMRISISIRHGDWNRAARAFQAYSLGVNDEVYSSLINEEMALFSSPGIQSLQTGSQRDVIGERNMAAVNNILEEAERRKRDSLSVPGEDDGLAADTSVSDIPATASNDRDDEDDSDESSSISSEESDAFVDPIDWTSWTQPADLENPVGAESDNHASSLSMPIVDQSELIRVLECTDLGLELASSALDSHRESTKQILGTLLAYASTLSKDRLEQLVDQMAMANMTESLRNLWSETVSAAKGTKGASQSISVAALLAASVGGIQDANMVESLIEAGLYPLAFLYAAVWGTSAGMRRVERVEAAWRDALA